jgi:hypothetical protein
LVQRALCHTNEKKSISTNVTIFEWTCLRTVFKDV